MLDRSIPSQQTAVSLISWLVEAFAAHQAGRLDEAERLYKQILAACPDHFDSLHLLGAISCQRGDYGVALEQIDRALAQDPNNGLALNHRGLALNGLKRFDDALASYDRALEVWPDHAEALFNRGVVLHVLRRFEEALASYERALALRPDHAEAWCNRGLTLLELKQFAAALTSVDRALALQPDYAEAFCHRSVALQELKRCEEALASCDRALALRPDYAEALCHRGNALYAMRRFEEALASYDRALALRPDLPEVHNNRGNALTALKRFEDALASFDRVLELWPERAQAYSDRGVALHHLKRFDAALASYDRALALQPDLAVAHANRGVAMQELKRFEEALASYERALAVAPDYADAHYKEAHCRMLIGDLPRGWQKYEWRWQIEQLGNYQRGFAQPLWLGSDDIAGKTVLLHADQGYGDTIQFCRYAPLVAARGARVILEVHKPLHDLMGTLAGPVQVIATGEPLPDFDLHCPLLSLPLAFATRLETIPAATPYLRACPAAASIWNARLGPRNRPRIGLAWSGNPRHENDHNRSIALRALLPLLDCVDATFVSLQRDVGAADAAVLQGRGDILNRGEELKSFADTAALIANLDLTISVDTSVAHLAGALAKPVWILVTFVSEWRWLLDRDDSPWYPTARLFRQDETRTWDNVIARVAAALRDHVRSL